MATATTKIEWCDRTWNPLAGCTRVSEGCRYCYAEKVAARFSGPGQPFTGLARRTPAGPRWTGAIALREGNLEEPLHWRRPRRVFVNSMADLFHPDVPDEFIDRVWAVMFLATQHTFQVLTKRPQRMRHYHTERLPHPDCPDLTHDRTYRIYQATINLFGRDAAHHIYGTAPNVWLGVSCEDQDTLDARLPHLLATPAAVRFLSLEPLLGQISLLPHARAIGNRPPTAIQWVIAGGESGGPPERRLVEPCRHVRPLSSDPASLDRTPHGCPHCAGTGWVPKPEALDWIRSLRDQCQAASVPFFFKGWGGPKFNSGGRLLDGRTHDEFPPAHSPHLELAAPSDW